MFPLKGAKEFCDYLKDKGYGIYVLSNASDKFYTYLPRFLPLDYFTWYVVSCDIHMLKPNEDIYKHILEKYNLKAEDCLFIDDADKNAEGAKKLYVKAEVFKVIMMLWLKKCNL